MKKLYILKAGTASEGLAALSGDYDEQTVKALGPVATGVQVVDAENGAELPRVEECAGVIITGSPLMVTDDLPWSIRLERWIPSLLERGIPLLGICYGHQLIARAMGGKVLRHPRGQELGTVKVRLLSEAKEDALFRLLPPLFDAHVSHHQTVSKLPPDAVLLAFNDHEPHHAFRLGPCAWGVQFHPEFSADTMRFLIEHRSAARDACGQDRVDLLRRVTGTPIAAQIMTTFARFADE